MINLIWLALFVIAFVMAGASGRIDETSSALFASAEKTVMFCLGLVGILAFWSGLMRVADESGLTQALARFCQPFLQRLFPSLKKNPKALGAVALSLAANILGLSNAATPLGIKAIQELQKTNAHTDEVSPSIGTYLALIMGGFTLIPSTVIAFRAQAGSLQPTDILGPILIATFVGTTTALVLNGVFSRRRRK
jgi:spore maturation protein A